MSANANLSRASGTMTPSWWLAMRKKERNMTTMVMNTMSVASDSNRKNHPDA